MLTAGIRPDGLQRSFPNQTIQWFYHVCLEIMNVLWALGWASLEWASLKCTSLALGSWSCLSSSLHLQAIPFCISLPSINLYVGRRTFFRKYWLSPSTLRGREGSNGELRCPPILGIDHSSCPWPLASGGVKINAWQAVSDVTPLDKEMWSHPAYQSCSLCKMRKTYPLLSGLYFPLSAPCCH